MKHLAQDLTRVAYFLSVNIGAGHRYFIYQEVFQAPGIYVRTGTIKAGDDLDVSEKTVEFVVEMEPIRFLQDIAVS